MRSLIQKMEKDFGIEWNKFAIGDLFDIRPTKTFALSNTALLKSNVNTPVISNSGFNNGITTYIDLSPTEKGNIITFSDTTTDEAIFYQPNDFIGYAHVQGMHKKFNEEIGEQHYLFIVTAFKNAVRGKYDYGNKFNRANAAKEIIYLPTVFENGKAKIAFDYIEKFMAALKDERIAKLDAYLNEAGLRNCSLTDDERAALHVLDGSVADKSGIEWKEYAIGDLFEILTTKKKFNAMDVTFGGKHRYIARGEGNNGIRGYITADDQYLNDANTISFGQDTATMFYQNESYFTGDKIKVFSPKKHIEFNKNTAQVFISAMTKAFSSFSWGSSSYKVSVLKSIKIQLPSITTNGKSQIAFGYMNVAISAMQKTVAKNLVNHLTTQMKNSAS